MHKDLFLKLQNSINNKEVLHIKNFFDINFTWHDAIVILDYIFQNTHKNFEHIENQINLNDERFPTIIKQSKYFHYHVWEILNTKNETNKSLEEQCNNIKILIDYCKSILPDNLIGTLKCSINFVGNEYVGIHHTDHQHVLAFQTWGNVKYYSGENEYLVSQGDIFFVPAGVDHSVTAHEPRFTLILDIENFNN